MHAEHIRLLTCIERLAYPCLSIITEAFGDRTQLKGLKKYIYLAIVSSFLVAERLR